MKIIITGSLGHISKPLVEELVQKGHAVSVISSNIERHTAIKGLGASSAIGAIQDVNFLTKTFTGADAVYLMEPPGSYFEKNPNPNSSWLHIANCYLESVIKSGITKIIHLSSVGAHTSEGVGMLETHYKVENILKELPENVSIKFMRPVGFYYNMFGFIPTDSSCYSLSFLSYNTRISLHLLSSNTGISLHQFCVNSDITLQVYNL